jgi:hypothetical protein
MAWIVPADVEAALGVPTAAGDADYLTSCTDAANVWAYERRHSAGYTDDQVVVPSERVKLGTVLYAVALYRERGSVDSFASFEDFPVPPPGTYSQINRLLGIPRPCVDLPTVPVVVGTDYLTQVEADARYSRLGHAHGETVAGTWTYSTNTSPPPNTGQVRIGTGVIYLSTQTDDGTDATAVLNALTGADLLVIQDKDDSTRFRRYDITAGVMQSGYGEITVTEIESSGTLSNNQKVIVAIHVGASA